MSKTQRNSFERWARAVLSKNQISLDNIDTDFKDGIKLLQLLEIVSGESLGKFDKTVKHKVNMLSNVNMVMEFLKSRGIKHIPFPADQIVDGNLKSTLHLLWMIYSTFKINDFAYGSKKGKDAFLLWAQSATYGFTGVNIANFSTSWQDGKAFCALVNKHKPFLLDYEKKNRG